jgi:hypothetical protein
MELRGGGKPSRSRDLSRGCGDAGEAEDLFQHVWLHTELSGEVQAFPRVDVRLLPTPFEVGDPPEPAAGQTDMPFVADRGCDLGRLGVQGGGPADVALHQCHPPEIDQRKGNPGDVTDPAAQLQAFHEVRSRALDVPKQQLRRHAEAVQRDRKREVVSCFACECDCLITPGECRMPIRPPALDLGQDPAEVGGCDRRR